MQSLFIRLKSLFNLLLIAYWREKKEIKAKNREIILLKENFDFNFAKKKS